MKFEICSVTIKLMAKGTEHLLNSTIREGVTPPEFLVLQHIHGEKNIQVIEQTMDKDPKGKRDPVPAHASETEGYNAKGRPILALRNHEQELDRLRNWYGPNAVLGALPGEKPRLPFTFEEARIHLKIPDNVTDLSDHLSTDEQKNKLGAAITGSIGG